MKVYMPLMKGVKDIHGMWNPFCYTLTDTITKSHKDVEFSFDSNIFCTDRIFDFDILHIMWTYPFDNIKTAGEFQKRLEVIKQHNIKIITTCHNIVPHYNTDSRSEEFSRITYEMSDVTVHLGQNSKNLFETLFPNTHHIIINHHIYDKIYSVAKKESFVKRIACIGAFRDKEERDMIKDVGGGHFSSLDTIYLLLLLWLEYGAAKRNYKRYGLY